LGLTILLAFLTCLGCFAIGYRTGRIDGESMGVPPMPSQGGWWCAHCGEHVPDQHVTYDERHDPEKGGCGHSVD
jgi:hypothetical protein